MMDSLFLIGVCVIVPIIVVWLNNRTNQNETNKKTEVLLKAIESDATIDPEYFKPQLSLKEKLLDKLTGASIATFMGLAIVVTTDTMVYDDIGGIIFAVGIALLISYIVGKRLPAKEIKAEEDAPKSEK